MSPLDTSGGASALPSTGNAAQSALAGLEQSDKEIAKTVGQEQQEMQPAFAQLGQIMAQPQPELGKLQKQPTAPDMAKQQQADAQDFMKTAVLVAGIAGAFSRQHVTTALNAFGAAIKGLKEGQIQAFTQASDEFEKASKAAVDNNNAAIEQYKSALGNRKASIDEQMARIQMIASKYQDKLMYEAASSKNYLMVARLMDQQQTAIDRLALLAGNLNQKSDEALAKIDAGLAEHGLKRGPDGKVIPDPQAASGVQATRAPRSAQAMAVQKFMQDNSNATAEDISTFGADYAAKQKAVAAFATGKQGDIVRSFNTATEHLNTLDRLAGALQNSDVRTFNRYAQEWAREFGATAPNNFDTAKQIVGDEVIKAVVGAGGGVGDREKMQAVIDRANTPEQLKQAIGTLRELIHGQLVGLKKQYEDTTGKTDFDSRMSGAAKAMLGAGPSAGSYSSPDDVLRALDAGEIKTPEDAKRILIDQFGYKPSAGNR